MNHLNLCFDMFTAAQNYGPITYQKGGGNAVRAIRTLPIAYKMEMYRIVLKTNIIIY